MKKVIVTFSLALFSLAAFANETNIQFSSTNKNGESKNITAVIKEAIKAKPADCVPSSYKVFHYVDCPEFSWFTVDWVDTIETRCVDGKPVRIVHHWDQDPALICS